MCECNKESNERLDRLVEALSQVAQTMGQLTEQMSLQTQAIDALVGTIADQGDEEGDEAATLGGLNPYKLRP